MAAASESVLLRLNRISLNNEIVLLRRVVAKAKVNVIRKITGQIKILKLEKSHHTEEIKLKNQAKAQRLIDELHLINTLKNDDISKTALIYDSAESLEVLQDRTSTVKEKLLAKIARNKVIVAGVEKMLSKYHPIAKEKLEHRVSNLGFKKRRQKKLGVPCKLTQAGNESDQSCDDSDEEEIPSIKKKKSKRTLPNDPGESAEELEGEEALDSADETGISINDERKSKRTVIQDSETSSDGMEPDTLNIDEAEFSKKKLQKSKSKKSKPTRNEMEVEEALDVEEVEMSTKKRKKANCTVTQDSDAPPDEIEDVEPINNNEVEMSAKKLKKSKSKASKSSSNVSKEALDCSNAEEISMQKKSKSKRKEILTDNEAVDKKDTSEEGNKINMEDKKANKLKNEIKIVPPEPKKVVHSTKAIRFSELLAMEAESHQSIGVKPQASEIKEVDVFFVSADGKSSFMSNVISDKPKDAPKTKINKYEKIREQYLKEFGAVPNRTELRRLEREGTKGSKSFHNLLVAPREKADRSTQNFSSLKAVEWPTQPNRKPTAEELPVHPSWEAKQKEKEKLFVIFQGKKTKFD